MSLEEETDLVVEHINKQLDAIIALIADINQTLKQINSEAKSGTE